MEGEQISPEAVTPEVLHAASDRYNAALSSLDPERLAECFAVDGEIEDPVGTGVHQGREQIAAYWAHGLCALVADLPVEVVAIQTAGSSVAVHWRTSALGRTGRRANTEGIDVLQIDADGLIIRAEGYWDRQAFVDALTVGADSAGALRR